MKKKIRLVLLLILAGVGAFFWWQKSPRDPKINGVRLSDWLRNADYNESASPIHKSDLLAAGPDAVHYLAHTIWAKYFHEFPLTGRLVLSGERWLPRKFVGLTVSNYQGSLQESLRAMDALASIYSESEAAKTAIFSLAADSNPELRIFSTKTLLGIGPSARPMLLHILRYGTPDVKNLIIKGMSDSGYFYAGARDNEWEAFLCSGLHIAAQDSSNQIRQEAARFLHRIFTPGIDHEFYYSRAIPDLERLLSDPDPDVRAAAKGELLEPSATSGNLLNED